MKIVFTGGWTGGHFYPIIAVAEALHEIALAEHLVEPELFYIAPDPFDAEALLETRIAYLQNGAGKVRRYFSILNFFDVFRTAWYTLRAVFILFRIYPDVVFSKGGGASVPTVVAAHWLGIPIVIHESDSKPGRATKLGAKYAKRIAVSYASSTSYFSPKEQAKIALTGIPVRKALLTTEAGASEELHLDPSVPTVLILGGSLGSKKINEVVVEGLRDLTEAVNVIHQTGKNNYAETESLAKVILQGAPHAARYHVFPYLSQDSLRKAAGAATLIISRAGSTSITEIALFKKPSILIPIPESVSHDQRTNAYSYAHLGGAVVLEEENMTPHVLLSEIKRITGDAALRTAMVAAGASFAKPEAAQTIARELMAISRTHETPKA